MRNAFYSWSLLCSMLCLGCEGSVGGGIPTVCSTLCPTGQVCNRNTGLCETPTQNPLTTPGPSSTGCTLPLVACGAACVNLDLDSNNCGQCGRSCGPNGQCQGGSCSCQGGFSDCNGDLFDGCECAGACNGAQCAGSILAQCSPSQASCPSHDQYCDGSSCRACPDGFSNCDGLDGCECTGGCSGNQCATVEQPKCDPSVPHSCGGVTAYCHDAKRECVSCPTTGETNCDGVFTCECSDGCFDGQCGQPAEPPPPPPPPPVTEPSCDYDDANVCGGNNTQWCWQQTCTECTTGFFNCNGTRGCECDSAGCNGTQCAGKCTGGECPPSCSDSTAFDCGGNDSFCGASGCQQCASGSFNCDGQGDCECAGYGAQCVANTCTYVI